MRIARSATALAAILGTVVGLGLGFGAEAATVTGLEAGVAAASAAAEPIIIVDRDDIVIDGDAIVQFTGAPITDDEGDGVVRIIADDAVVRFIGELRGAPVGSDASTWTGVGVVITGDRVSLAGGRIAGFGVGLHVDGADEVAIVGTSFEDGRRDRLASTPEREDPRDWIRPHENDGGEWAARYGAAIRVTDARDPSLRELTVRGWQNGLLLERVTGGTVADCDASFLSGWGCALWRTSGVLIARNAFDFCVRGYSHGVYNRGQDSAGLLLFEQCHDNVIVRNSMTHGGDGLFAFAGREALGEIAPREDLEWYRGRGHHGNLIAENDFSHAAAHGLELTFAGPNRITGNAFTGNAICGIWGGFSQGLVIDGNVFEANGDAGYGLERGGVNIEHGSRNRIVGNAFRRNVVGIHLWDDEASGLYATPWGRANRPGTRDTLIAGNTFDGDTGAVQLRAAGRIFLDPAALTGAVSGLDADEASKRNLAAPAEAPDNLTAAPAPVDVDALVAPLGRGRDPRGARRGLGARDAIVMTADGPWDHEGLIFRRLAGTDLFDEYEIRGPDGIVDPRSLGDRLSVTGAVRLGRRPKSFAVLPLEQPVVSPYEVRLEVPRRPDQTVRGTVRRSQWTVLVFPWTTDPVAERNKWRSEAYGRAIEAMRFGLRLPFGNEGPSESGLGPAVRTASLASDRFGLFGQTELEFPPGRWRVRTLSDDGVRVALDGEVVIDEWTVHVPTVHEHAFTLEGPAMIMVEIEYFENTGYAVLEFDVIYDGPLEGDEDEARRGG